MSRRTKGLLAPLLLAAVAVAGLWWAWKRFTRPPNVVLIVVDSLRADHLGAYGYPRDTSPNLDELVRDGVLYSNAVSSAPWTTPAVAGIMTGLHPTALGIGEKPVPIPAGVPTIASTLAAAGYDTHGIVSHSYLSERLGFSRGFDTWNERHAGGHEYVSSLHVTDLALEVLEAASARRGRPFFLSVHYFDPHFEYLEHPGFGFPSDGTEGSLAAEDLRFNYLRKVADQLEPEDLARVKSLYDSEIAFTDAQLGRLLTALEELDLYENTLIIFVADHGEAFAERASRRLGHTGILFREVIRVPLIIKPPGGAEASEIETPISTLDIFPTILDVVGKRSPGREEPADRSLLRVDEAEPPAAFSESIRGAKARAVTQGRWKLMYSPLTGRRQLFDLANDVAEENDVSKTETEVTERLVRLLGEWSRAVESERVRESGEEPRFTDEEIERLKGLGYID